MTIETTRRGFLKFLGIGAAAAIIEEPVRKLWFVGSNAPVGSRIERTSSLFNAEVAASFKQAFALPGEYMLPSNGRTWGWHADADPGSETVRIYNGSKQLMGRISVQDWENDRTGALEDMGFRMSDGYKSDEKVKDYERARAKAADMSKADQIAKQWALADEPARHAAAHMSLAGRIETVRILQERAGIDAKTARELLFGDYALAGNG